MHHKKPLVILKSCSNQKRVSHGRNETTRQKRTNTPTRIVPVQIKISSFNIFFKMIHITNQMGGMIMKRMQARLWLVAIHSGWQVDNPQIYVLASYQVGNTCTWWILTKGLKQISRQERHDRFELFQNLLLLQVVVVVVAAVAVVVVVV